MEIDPKAKKYEEAIKGVEIFGESNSNMFTDIINSLPGIDEAIAFSELMSSIDKMEYDLLIFDTAPTGHTLKFLNIP